MSDHIINSVREGQRLLEIYHLDFHLRLACAGGAAEAARSEGAQEGGLRSDQMAQLDEGSDEEMLEGGGVVLEDAASQHVDGVSETGAKAGNHAAAAALKARLHGESPRQKPGDSINIQNACHLACKASRRLATRLVEHPQHCR